MCNSLGKDKHIILTIDQAGWHISPQIRVPEGVHLEFRPSHSPELQPAERLWPLVNEAIANRSFQNLDELEEVLFQRCQVLLKQSSLIKQYFGQFLKRDTIAIKQRSKKSECNLNPKQTEKKALF